MEKIEVVENLNIIHNIELHGESIDYLKKVFESYKEINYDGNEVFKNPIIHLYPTEDTRSRSGELNGYGDSLFVTVKIYDYNSNKFMQLNNRDGVDFYNDNTKVHQVRVFKDGSTMIILRGEYRFGSCQSIDVWKV